MALPELARLPLASVSAAAWGALIFSAVFALFAAYIVWHTAIQRIGNVRTSMYSNLIPVSALATAVVVARRPADAPAVWPARRRS